ncbi:MAG: outer membrane beta-barrel protein [Ferruginibacter sp.]
MHKKKTDSPSFSGKGFKAVNIGYGFLNRFYRDLEWHKIGPPPGPYVVGFEYGISDKIGVGAQLGYSKFTKQYQYDPSYTGTLTQTLVFFVGMARANYHFGKPAKFDPYVGFGLGIYSFKPYTTTTLNGISKNSPFTLLRSPFAYTLDIGAKYFFSDKIGAYAEVGFVTGSYAQLGVAAKF